MHVATITAHFNDRRRAPRFLRGARRSFYGTYALGSARRPSAREKAPRVPRIFFELLITLCKIYRKTRRFALYFKLFAIEFD